MPSRKFLALSFQLRIVLTPPIDNAFPRLVFLILDNSFSRLLFLTCLLPWEAVRGIRSTDPRVNDLDLIPGPAAVQL